MFECLFGKRNYVGTVQEKYYEMKHVGKIFILLLYIKFIFDCKYIFLQITAQLVEIQVMTFAILINGPCCLSSGCTRKYM